MRGSDPDASLYWLARMLAGGEHPLYNRAASGAYGGGGYLDPPIPTRCCKPLPPRILTIFSGRPKANSPWRKRPFRPRYRAEIRTRATAAFGRGETRGGGERLALAAETHSQCADQADEAGEARKGANAYDHDEEAAFSGQNYFPDGMERQLFYAPTTYGYEAELEERLKRFAELRKARDKR